MSCYGVSGSSQAFPKMMRYVPVSAIGVAMALGAPATALADETQLWTEAGVEFELWRRWSAVLNQNVRFDDHVSRVGAVMPEADLRYRPAGWLRLGVGYRYAYERDNAGEFRQRHRIHAEVRPRLRLEVLDAWYRLRWQEQFRRQADDGTRTRHVLRNQLGVQWTDWELMEPYASAETFHRLDEPDAGVVLNKLRLVAGVERDFDDHALGTYYGLEVMQYDPEDPRVHIVGVKYQYDW
jgi:hypothetical protein